MSTSADQPVELWPELPLDAWSDTYATLHMWTQIVGKLRMVQSPWTNHSWHVTLYVTSRGLSTLPVPHGNRSFQIDFDFVDHRLLIQTSDGGSRSLPLEPQSVSTFYTRVMGALSELDLAVKIYRKPNEVADAIPFDLDETHKAYDPEYANRYWRILVQVDRVARAFRARFIGKCSPIHFFWGAPDLAVTRFSGRLAPEHPGGVPNLPDRVAREAYSHEVSSCGFWAGGGPITFPAFYAYAYPQPAGFPEAAIKPRSAIYNAELGEFILRYDDVRKAQSPDEMLLDFMQSTYEAAADLAGWDRAALEKDLTGLARTPGKAT